MVGPCSRMASTPRSCNTSGVTASTERLRAAIKRVFPLVRRKTHEPKPRKPASLLSRSFVACESLVSGGLASRGKCKSQLMSCRRAGAC